MAKYRILIVEDSPTMRQLLAFALRPISGSRIVEATDGLDGLKKAQQEQFDLAIVDINMPVMDGLKLISILKEDSKTASMPIVIISTESGTDILDKAKALGVDDYITKPITAANVLKTIKELLPEK